LAVLAGLSPRQVADLDEDEFIALQTAVEEREKDIAWGNLHEVVASAVEALWAILARLNGGIPTVNIRAVQKAEDTGPYPRPEWVDQPDENGGEIVVTSVADALRMMKGGDQTR
jgi:hypothetical protein